jgi:tRNA (guanine-N7-)-methyltransferase
MVTHFEKGEGEGGLWERVGRDEEEADLGVRTMRMETEEGKKVERNAGVKYVACWRRREDPEWE